MLDQIIKDLKKFSFNNSKEKPKLYCNSSTSTKQNILLTGAVGFLGVHILNSLLENTNSNIFCLIRTKFKQSPKIRLQKALKAASYDKHIFNNRIKILEGDLYKENLGINNTLLTELANSIDRIYHCGANVHHLHNYYTLRSDVKATYFLIKFATQQKLKELHFISTMYLYDKNSDKIWEPSYKLENIYFNDVGYIQAKWVCEKILHSYIINQYPFYIYRPGNITGHSKTGYSIPNNNHGLLLLKGFLQERIAPRWEDIIEMVPVNLLSDAIVAISLDTNKLSKNIFNLHNSKTITWEDYITKTSDELKINIKFIDVHKWRTEVLPNISQYNPIYLFKDFYKDASSKFSYQPIQDKYTEELLQELDKRFNTLNYDNIVRVYARFLSRSKFLK